MLEITSRKNTVIVHLKKLGADGDYRRACGEFLCDGEKLLREAVLNDVKIKTVLTSRDTPEWLPEGVPVYRVGQDLIGAVSPLKTPQGLLFSCGIPAQESKRTSDCTVLILEGIQDPGNVGTVIRTAGAFKIGTIVLTGGCADPYNPKSVRASMGAIFRQNIIAMEFDAIAALKGEGVRLYGAALGDSSRDIREVSLKNAAVAIGSEGRGLSEEMLALCDEKIIIPMAPGSESLNAAAAAAIIMWEANKDTL